MKTNEIQVGNVYAVKVSGRVQPVRITERTDTPTRRHYGRMGNERVTRASTRFYGTNTNTGRTVGPFTAAKCRHPATPRAVKVEAPTPLEVAASWTQTNHGEHDSNGSA